MIEEDETADALVRVLSSEGAGRLGHGGGRVLLDHLLGTYWIVRRWDQPAWLQHAALLHSVYGSDAYHQQLVAPERRRELAGIAGDQAERLAYLFCVTPRGPLLAGTHRWARDLPAGCSEAPTRDELDALVLLHMANLAEQARARDGSPGRWLVRLWDLAELLADSEAVEPPSFTAQLTAFSEEDEALTLRAYARAASEDPDGRASALALAAAKCPVVPEPCVWLAHAASCRDDEAAARMWTQHARKRLGLLGTAWDKRLTLEQWLAIIEALERSLTDDRQHNVSGSITDPRVLFDATVRGAARPARSPAGFSPAGPSRIVPPDTAAGRRRFQRYIDGLADGDEASAGRIYPDLPSQPWHDPDGYPLAGYLEDHYEQIRDEILALDGRRFHRESERIERTGDWDVAFFYERGRRREEVCAACPVTAHGIDTYPAIRTVAGLIYVSRMRPGTHISPHRGPTNLRVRCHLGIEVPVGDCAIEVDGIARRWEEGKCLVFDDYLVHEAWNHTDEDRIVLIVDLWHPGLSPTEVRLLEGLHGYVYVNARRLSGYWAANAAASRD
jgi:aspartyl/asparaginyl beta-hydroxylase (cupin superfamily)